VLDLLLAGAGFGDDNHGTGKGAIKLAGRAQGATIFPDPNFCQAGRGHYEFAAATLTPGCEFDPIARVKYVLPLLVAVVCALAACKTTSDRRDLFSPNKPQGPATAELRDWTLFGHNNHKSTTYSYPVAQAGAAAPDSGPIAPPPPVPPADSAAPDNAIGAPEATPVPGTMTPHVPKYTPQSVPPAASQPAGGADAIPVATPTDAGGGGGSDSGGGSSIPGLSQ
jgi:hypothetical protein